jgi:hypothetical protein
MRGWCMNVKVNTFGARSDVQPPIAMRLDLQQSVHIHTNTMFETFVRNFGLDFYPRDVDPREVLTKHTLSKLGKNLMRISIWMQEKCYPVLREFF